MKAKHRRDARPPGSLDSSRSSSSSGWTPRRWSAMALGVALGWGAATLAGAQQGRPGGIGAVAEYSFARALAAPPALQAVAGEPLVRIDIETPEDGVALNDSGGLAFVAGRVLARYGGTEAFDIMFAIDRSESTTRSSGSDVNGDGRVDTRTCGNVPSPLGLFAVLGGVCRPSPDSILNAEIAAVRALLRQLDSRRTRVGVVVFSGDRSPETPDARVAVNLTADYSRVEAALDAIEEEGPSGRTNIEAAIRVAASELLDSRIAFNSLGAPIEQVILFLSDGVPTLPIQESILSNRRRALTAALEAAREDIRMDTFGIGSEALRAPETLFEMAQVSAGVFTPVEEPRDLRPIFENVNFSGIDQIRINNLSTSVEANYVRRDADGSFAALVPMREGENTIEVSARAIDGSVGTRKLRFRFDRTAEAGELPVRLVAERNRLLEDRLSDLRADTNRRSAEVVERARQELVARIERARARAAARARNVRIEPDAPEEPPPPDGSSDSTSDTAPSP